MIHVWKRCCGFTFRHGCRDIFFLGDYPSRSFNQAQVKTNQTGKGTKTQDCTQRPTNTRQTLLEHWRGTDETFRPRGKGEQPLNTWGLRDNETQVKTIKKIHWRETWQEAGTDTDKFQNKNRKWHDWPQPQTIYTNGPWHAAHGIIE